MQKEEATLRWPRDNNSREQLWFLKLEGQKGRGKCEQNFRVQRRSLKELVVRSWKGDTSREENTVRSSGTDLGGGGIVMRLALGVLKDAGPPAAARVTRTTWRTAAAWVMLPGPRACREKKYLLSPSFSLPLYFYCFLLAKPKREQLKRVW